MADNGHEQPPAVDTEAIARAVADQVIDRVTDRLTARLSVDLLSVQSALAEVVDALAFQIDENRTAAAGTLAAIEVLADRVDTGPVDLEPIRQHLDALPGAADLDGLRHHIDATTDLTPLVARIDALAASLDASVEADRPEPVDLGPLQATLDTIVDRTDLAPLHQRLDEIGRRLDLESIRAGIAEVVEANAVQLEATERTATELGRAIAQASTVGPQAVELGPILHAVDALRQHYDATQPDLSALIDAMVTMRSQIVDAVRDAGASTHVDLGPVVAEMAEQRAGRDEMVQRLRSELRDLAQDVRAGHDAAQASLARIESTWFGEPENLEPLLDAVDGLRASIPTVDLQPLHDRIAELAERIPEAPDLASLHAAIADLETKIPGPTDLTPLHTAVADLGASIPPGIDPGPIRDDLAALRDAISSLDLHAVHDQIADVRRAMPVVDLAPVTDAIDAVRADLPTVDLDPVLVALEAVRARVDSIELDTDPIQREVDSIRSSIETALVDLTPVRHALEGLERRLDDRSDVDQLTRRLDSLQSAVDSLRSDEALHEAEHRLSRRVDSNSEALRARIDDQRVLADSLAANVSQLNAALTVASEEPQQLRRDLDRILEQLAERMGGAMRELRNELKGAEEPLALRSSVEAGLDRITGRFQTDTGRILEAVAAAQEDADGRLRRIDSQVTELRRAVERVRRDSEGLPSVSSS